MKQGAIRILQEILTERGLYNGPVDSNLHPAFANAVAGLVEDRRGELTQSPANWSDKRKRVAAFQLVCKDAEFDPGPIDGLWGQQTEFAYGQLDFFRETGTRPLNFRDIVPLDVNPHGWPTDKPGQAALFDFFDFDPRGGGDPPMTIVQCPWELTLDFDPSAKTHRIGCHPKAAASLESVLTRIHQHYGTATLREMRMHLYAGGKSVRLKKGGSTWSIHSFAAAFDWDPSRNKLKSGWQDASMARPEFLDWWRFWEEEGWLSLGRTRNFDWMHVQAVKLP